jgi:hypothetical protein
MRAILLLLMVAAGCGGKSGSTVELDVAVEAPAAASALVDGNRIAANGGVLTRVFGSLAAASAAKGNVQSLNSDDSVRAMVAYSFGSYCSAVAPLARETQRFQERLDGTGATVLTLLEVDCIRTDGTGTIVSP